MTEPFPIAHNTCRRRASRSTRNREFGRSWPGCRVLQVRDESLSFHHQQHQRTMNRRKQRAMVTVRRGDASQPEGPKILTWGPRCPLHNEQQPSPRRALCAGRASGAGSGGHGAARAGPSSSRPCVRESPPPKARATPEIIAADWDRGDAVSKTVPRRTVPMPPSAAVACARHGGRGRSGTGRP